ncbi:MAG TPA: acyl-CoA dehydrogenase [Deltaproteobacteria bacterium]|nr:acyl-CoA dehydrogenase [Candidatus Binatota bacterium]HIL14013.1 acyl-CoA dehydrogenase [Deltaproteobacteria bacterium]
MSDANINFFKADMRSMEFTLYEHLGVQELFEHEFFEHLSREDCDQVMQQTLRFSNDMLGPINSSGDRQGCTLKDGVVTTPDGYKEAWKQLWELGLPNFSVSLEAGGFQGPMAVLGALSELQMGANISFTMYSGLTYGAMELVEHFGTDHDKARFLEGMTSGRYAGTMCLSEPHAGSDVGAISTTATHIDGNRYLIKGSKCWISGGDHDLADNIIHLLLARVDGAPGGTQGISLFIVPRDVINEDGSSGENNNVVTASLEHKLGINSSATAVLNFGDDGDCVGYLCGSEENVGMKQMFMMMNGARLSVGLQGHSVAATAYLNALAYARDRKQGASVKAFKDPNAPRVSIIEHSDVRRMLLEMKSKIDGMRAIAGKMALHLDWINVLKDKDPDQAAYHQGQADLLTPIVKAYCSDQGFRVCETAMQVYGGAGYVKDNPVEQYLRDSKIFSIYEGTNHIQALDLVVRKLRGRKGQDLADFSGNLTEFVEANSQDPAIGTEAQLLGEASERLQTAGAAIVGYMMEGKLDQLTLYATPFMQAMSHVAVCHLLLEAALVAEGARTQDFDQSQEEFDFYAGKVMSGKFYANFIMPEVFSLCRAICSADRSAIDIPDNGFCTQW